MLNIGQTLAARSMKWRVYASDSIFSGRILPWLMLAVLATSPVVCAGDDRKPTRTRPTRLKKNSSRRRFARCSLTTAWSATGLRKHKGGLRLDVRAAMLKGGETGPAVVPGKPDESPLIEAIRYEGDVQMPPKKKLKDEEIAALTEWVKRGAFWPEPRPGVGARRSHKRLPRPQPSQHASQRVGPGHVILVVPAGLGSGTAAGQGRHMASFADRPVHPGQARGERPGAGAAGRQSER